jgi:hypothetical protein
LEKYRARLVTFTFALWDTEVRLREGSRWQKKRVIAALDFYQGLVYALSKALNYRTKKHL